MITFSKCSSISYICTLHGQIKDTVNNVFLTNAAFSCNIHVVVIGTVYWVTTTNLNTGTYMQPHPSYKYIVYVLCQIKGTTSTVFLM